MPLTRNVLAARCASRLEAAATARVQVAASIVLPARGLCSGAWRWIASSIGSSCLCCAGRLARPQPEAPGEPACPSRRVAQSVAFDAKASFRFPLASVFLCLLLLPRGTVSDTDSDRLSRGPGAAAVAAVAEPEAWPSELRAR